MTAFGYALKYFDQDNGEFSDIWFGDKGWMVDATCEKANNVPLPAKKF
jgi:hypothetical protein